MSEKRTIKKQLSRLIHYRSNLPKYIDNSYHTGDNVHTSEDCIIADEKVIELKTKFKQLVYGHGI